MALDKFNWQNGSQVEPAKVEIEGVSYDVVDAQYEGETPLSASNLNLMQDTILGNVKDDSTDDTKIASVKLASGVVLYSNTDGGEFPITLSDSASNYRKLEITFSRGGNTLQTASIDSLCYSNTVLNNIFYQGEVARIYNTGITISGTSITRNYGRLINFQNASGATGRYETGNDYTTVVYKVVGYK